jgi:hypothetical protein
MCALADVELHGSEISGYFGLNGEPITVCQWCELYDRISETRISTLLESDPVKRVVTEWTGVDPECSEGGLPWEVRVETPSIPGPDGVVRGPVVHLRARTHKEAIETHWATVRQLETRAR